jgi:hypothetical protein
VTVNGFSLLRSVEIEISVLAGMFEARTDVTVKILVFWGFALYRFGNYLPFDKAKHPRRL